MKQFWLFFLWIAFSCSSSNLSDDPIPIVPFADLTISIVAPENQKLLIDGGFKEMNSIGVRGVILYRKSSTYFIAYERNCSYHPNGACATVNINSSGLYMTDPCCGSNFNFSDGTPSGGIAWRPLRRYRCDVAGTQVTIGSDILN